MMTKRKNIDTPPAAGATLMSKGRSHRTRPPSSFPPSLHFPLASTLFPLAPSLPPFLPHFLSLPYCLIFSPYLTTIIAIPPIYLHSLPPSLPPSLPTWK